MEKLTVATPSPSTCLLRLYDICSHFELLDYYVQKPHSTFQFSPPNDGCANRPTHPVPSVCASSQSLLQLPQEPHFGSSSTNTETPPGYTKQTDVWRNRLSKFFVGATERKSRLPGGFPSTREIHRLSGNLPSPKLPPYCPPNVSFGPPNPRPATSHVTHCSIAYPPRHTRHIRNIYNTFSVSNILTYVLPSNNFLSTKTL